MSALRQSSRGRRALEQRRDASVRAKRLIDMCGATALLLVTSPLLATAALAIRLSDGAPVLFRQARPGLNDRIFTMYKFRTMRDPAPGEDRWTTDGARVTKTGALLRRTSLDELPELFNVMRGEMSLVGPRPLLIDYLDKYSDEHRRRHDMKPGITGLAQVSGRRRLSFRQRLDLDIEYVDNWSLRLDLQILFRTLLEPFKQGSDETQQLSDVDDLGFFSAA